MIPAQIFVMTLITLGLAQTTPKWTIHKGCDMFKGQNIRENLKQSVVEGLELAETAASVMRNHADDPWVQKMSRLVLGDRDTFQTRFEFVRGIFERVAAFEREPSPLQPLSPEWAYRAGKSNKDWEIYCDRDRFYNTEGKYRSHAWTTSKAISPKKWPGMEICYSTDYRPGSGHQAAKMITMDSDRLNTPEWFKAQETDADARAKDYVRESDDACSTDICTWFIDDAVTEGWPRINDARLATVKSDQYRARSTRSLPVDGLKTIGSTFLHEVTHTSQGGKLDDVSVSGRLAESIPSCYEWECVLKLGAEPSIRAEFNAGVFTFS
ncbi:hypothetical protein CGGC5_v010181 [Colletotrichum fructicola Nara gc5]|uniref:Lysine-specific metallo-endopeptidase domain-containing protein n=2 Tax=Colletotrichum fructicola (strain Nara gc5) TaxID=1213859 RepID=A0A7J6IXH1_COLFN|nr:hypothetical protein CGGC5_v010181 [Colletotrichum fructicola Nara gc5]